MHLKTSMTGIAASVITLFSALHPSGALARESVSASKITAYSQLLFLENKGQVADQNYNPRTDIDFRVSGGDVNVFVGKGQIHYQWTRVQQDLNSTIEQNFALPGQKHAEQKTKNIDMYRLDAVLVGANVNAEKIIEERSDYYENYYLPQCPNGTVAHSFNKITYRNVYPGIDWVLYTSDNQLKYDFVVHKGGNPADIKLRYEGASSINMNNDIVSIATPYGVITENKPYSYDAETHEEIASSFALANNTLSFNVAASEHDIIIDPVIGWGTYFGLPMEAGGYSVAADGLGKGYLSGSTTNTSNISTFGYHQFSYGGGSTDGYIIKFSVAGTKEWSTYYGGEGDDAIYGSTVDASGNLYITGSTYSVSAASAISTSGAHQTSNGISTTSARDAFVAKFSASGSRTWGTFYGGNLADYATSVAVDKNGNVFIGGSAGSSNGTSIATTGAFQTTQSPGFVAKFNSSGVRQWGTYYGNGGNELVNAVACDTSGNVYIGGVTLSASLIATTGAFQTSLNGATDGFIVKFSSTGGRQWGTYYGGTAVDYVSALSCDRYNNLIVAGRTSSTTSISSTGAHKTALTGNSDGFLARFNASTGQRIWGTYYGGSGDDEINGVYAGRDRKIYITGATNSSTGIATTGNYQTTYGGNTLPSGSGDGFLTKFSLDGSRLWATYYGGSADESNVVVAFGGGKLYIAGTTTSDNGIATANGFQNFLSGTPPPTPPSPFPPTAFCAQFQADTAVYIDEIFWDTLTCLKDTLYIKYDVTNNFRPGNVFTLQMSNAFGSFANPTNINTVTTGAGGIFKYWIADTVTPAIGYRIRIVSSSFADTTVDNGKDIRVSEYPVPGAVAVFPICANGDLVLVDQGTGPNSTNYEWKGPSNFSIQQHSYTRPNVQVTDSGWYYLIANNYGCIATDSVHVLIYSKPNKPIIHSNSPVCATDTLKVWATTTTPGISEWTWQKPAGYVPSTKGDTTIPVSAMTDAGVYKAIAIAGGCASDPDSTTVVIESKAAPTVQIAVNPTFPGPWVNMVFTVTGSSNEGSSPTYQWTKNGIDIAGATSNTYTTTSFTDLQNGDTICVRMHSSVGCAIPQTVKSCIGIAIDMGVKELASVGSVSLYPNPNNGNFTLNGKMDNNKPVTIQVMNVVGQVMFEEVALPEGGQLNKQLSLANIPEGVYLLHLKTDSGSSTLKFTVNK